MKEVIKSPELQAKLIPEQVGVDVYTKVEISPHHLPICSPRSFEFGCRRIIPGLTWMQAVQEPNVSILRGGIEKVTPDSVISTEGERKVDAILCATGFNNSFTPPFPIEGLKKDWADHPEAYLSMGVAGYPNYFMCLGPNTTISNGDTVNLIHTMARYIRQAVEKMQKDQIRTLQVREKVQQKYNEYIQKILTLTVGIGISVSISLAYKQSERYEWNKRARTICLLRLLRNRSSSERATAGTKILEPGASRLSTREAVLNSWS